jgi:hypothetical protein
MEKYADNTVALSLLVTAYSGIMVHIAGLGETHHRMN